MESDVTQSALFYKLWAWGEAHKKQLLGALVAIVVVGLGIAFWFAHQTQQQTDANQALSKLVGRNTMGLQAPPEALLSMAGSYPNTDAGQRAALLAASDLYAQGNYDQARGQFQRFLQEHGDSPFVGEAALGVAACMDAQGRTEDAINSYLGVADRYPNSGVVPQAKLALGRLYQIQGKLTDAKQQLLDVVRNYPGQMNAEATKELEDLFTAHPELIPQRPAPPPAPVTPPANHPGTPPLMIPTNQSPGRTPILTLPSATNKP